MNFWEASQRGFQMLGITMAIWILFDWLLRGEVRYDKAFWFSVAFSTAFSICSMIFKVRPVFRE